ncbi:MAG: response regulator [Deltaproteobacteria bacterium]|nr:response regulator [Deltaproteobacteria bacterium]
MATGTISAPAPLAEPNAVRSARSENRPPRVLVADDDFEMRRFIASALRRDGCQVVEVPNGMEMLDVLASELLFPKGNPPVDLIISDLRMPGVTGLSVLSGLQDSGWTTPFILITGFGGPEVESQAIREGAAAVFDKPFDIDELRRTVLDLIGPSESGETNDLGGEG